MSCTDSLVRLSIFIAESHYIRRRDSNTESLAFSPPIIFSRCFLNLKIRSNTITVYSETKLADDLRKEPFAQLPVRETRKARRLTVSLFMQCLYTHFCRATKEQHPNLCYRVTAHQKKPSQASKRQLDQRSTFMAFLYVILSPTFYLLTVTTPTPSPDAPTIAMS